jgi:hypothetical protein
LKPVRPAVHQRLQPAGTLRIHRFSSDRVDKQLHPQVLPDRRFTLGLGEAAHRIEVVGLDAVEVVLGLRIGHAEHRIGIGLAVHMGDAPVVARDGDGLSFALPVPTRARQPTRL